MYSIYGKQLICLRNKLRLALPNGKIVGLLPNGNRRQMRPKSTTNYLAGYPQALLEEVRQLIAENRLAALLLKKYPLAHGVRTDKALYDYVQELKGQHMRNAGQLSVVSFDGTLQALRNALRHVQSVDPVPEVLLLTGDLADMPHVEELMQQEFAGKLSICRSAPFFIETMPLGVGKDTSLEILLRAKGLTPANLMACGDGWNDLPMIRLAGMGVAMGNAQPPVKAAANYLTADNDHDGVGLAVEKFILNEET